MALIEVGDVARHLNLGALPAAEKAGLDTAVAAVNSLIPRWIDAARLEGDDVKLGAIMLAARLYRRRNSPAGVESFGELGPVYVSRNDPDLAMVLGLGNYARPRVA